MVHFLGRSYRVNNRRTFKRQPFLTDVGNAFRFWWLLLCFIRPFHDYSFLISYRGNVASRTTPSLDSLSNNQRITFDPLR